MTSRAHGSRARRSVRRSRVLFVATTLALMLTAGLATSPAAAEVPADVLANPLLQPVDAQNWVDQADLTWADYTQVRPDAWNSDTTSTGSQNQYRTAIILVDYPDQPFLITQAPETHPFGNPQAGWTPVAPADVNEWFRQYYAVPNVYNGFQTLHGYWMEDTHGKIGVTVDVFGPYTMPGKQFEYGLATDFNGAVGNQSNSSCPAGHTCNRNIRTGGLAAWQADTGCSSLGACGYNNGFYVTAGHDESSTWQEFGEMLWSAREDVPAQFGPPGAVDGPVLNNAGNPIPNWAPTRYVPWSSWRAASNHWPNASGGTSTQAESSGQSVFAHEFSHLRGLPDNYNNPFQDNIRNYTGYWEMMSRGTFNGPGGTHNRWQIPNAGGSALGPHHMLHFKNSLSVLGASDQLTLQRNDLATQGVAVVPVKVRSAPPDGDLVGLTVNFGTGGDLAGSCANQGLSSFYCPGTGYLNYRIEVIDRVGNDSFAPGHGVLISKSRNSGTPQVWLIDPNVQDIGMIDFYRPDGTPVAVVRGDPRQLNDATYHAGTNSGSAYELVDNFNRLNIYVLDSYRDENGDLFYDIGVRRFDGAGPFQRGLALGSAYKTPQEDGYLASCTFPLTNTGEAGEGIFDSDVYRLSASSSSGDWEITLPNALAAVEAGEMVEIPVHALRANDAGDEATVVSLTATSESDQSKTATRTCTVHARDTADGGGFLATYHGPPALEDSGTSGTATFWFRQGGDQGLDILADGSPVTRQIDCDTKEPIGDPVAALPPSWGGLSYQAYTDRYSYVWKLPKGNDYAGTCREFLLDLDDGSQRTAWLRFVK